MTRRKPPKPPRVATIPARADTVREVDGELEKICRGCNVWWPATTEFFTSHIGRPDNLAYRCRACTHEHLLAADHRRRASARPFVPAQLHPLGSVPWLSTTLPAAHRSPT